MKNVVAKNPILVASTFHVSALIDRSEGFSAFDLASLHLQGSGRSIKIGVYTTLNIEERFDLTQYPMRFWVKLPRLSWRDASQKIDAYESWLAFVKGFGEFTAVAVNPTAEEIGLLALLSARHGTPVVYYLDDRVALRKAYDASLTAEIADAIQSLYEAFQEQPQPVLSIVPRMEQG